MPRGLLQPRDKAATLYKKKFLQNLHGKRECRSGGKRFCSLVSTSIQHGPLWLLVAKPQAAYNRTGCFFASKSLTRFFQLLTGTIWQKSVNTAATKVLKSSKDISSAKSQNFADIPRGQVRAPHHTNVGKILLSSLVEQYIVAAFGLFTL